MTLRKKTLAIVSLTIVISILLLYNASRIIVSGSFTKLEEQYTHQHVERVRDKLLNEFAILDSIVFDWAAWDDTYIFIEDTNEEYIQSNLVDETFAGFRLNLVLFIHSSGKIVFEKAFDLDNKKEISLPQYLRELLTSDAKIFHHSNTESSITGFLLLPEGPLLIASRPILTSQEKGPIRGTLIMGRYLDSGEVNRLAEMTDLSLTMHRFDDPEMSPDVQKARLALLDKSPVFIQPQNAEFISGYVLLNDIHGKPGLILKADIPRKIYRQGQTSMLYLILLHLSISLVLGVTTLLLLEKMVLARLARLNASVRSIQTSSDLSKRILVAGKDELSSLASEINEMLATLEQSQAELRESEDRYRSLVENAPLGIISVDSQGQIKDINSMLIAMLGSPSVEAAREISIFTSPSLVKAGIAEDFRRCLDSGCPDISERRYTTEWGKQVYLRYHLSPIKTIDASITGVQAIVEDNTERILVEEALKESEAEYRSLFKNMHSGLAYHKIVVDAQHKAIDYVFLDVNEAFETLTGLQDVVGKRATEVFPELHRIEPDLIQVYGQVALTGEETTFDTYFERFGLWFSISAYSPERGYFVTVWHDITERKWAEEALWKLNEDLEQRVAARTRELQRTNQFLQESLETLERTQRQLVESEKMAALGGLVAGVAHEINTPLGIGVTAASHLEQQSRELEQLYRDDQMTRSDLERYVKTACDSTAMILENLRRAAANIKSFKQVAVDQTSDTRREFRLKQCVENVLLSLYPKLKRTQHTVTVMCPEDLELDSYPGAFSQIITNFVMNSLLHGFEFEDEPGHIVLEIRAEEGILWLRYSDDGRGMSEEERVRIFEPFYTTKRGQGGSGLGLHIVYNLVTQALGGRIKCESTPGSGTTFTIEIPIKQGGKA